MELIKQQLYGVQFNYNGSNEHYRYIQVEAESMEAAIEIAKKVSKQEFSKNAYILYLMNMVDTMRGEALKWK